MRSVMRHVRGKWYRVQARDAYQRSLLKASGNVRCRDPWTMLLYLIERDEIPFGRLSDLVEQALLEVEADPELTNGWAGKHAEHLARRMRRAG